MTGSRGKGRKAVTENEVFVILMQVAREDPAVREKLLPILRMDEPGRRAALPSLLKVLRTAGAPPALLDAMGYLGDGQLARRALEFLEMD